MQLQSLIEDALELEQLDTNLFRSKNHLWIPIGAKGVFGGQVLGLSLFAATKTVSDQFLVHSLHSYFLLSGDSAIPIIFTVIPTRTGKSFATRTVEARQHGKVIFILSASFQVPQETSVEHQLNAPEAPQFDQLMSEEDQLNAWLNKPRLPQKYHNLISLRLSQPIPITLKVVPSDDKNPNKMMWIKAKGELGELKQTFHQVIAAYASDHVLLTTCLKPHGLTFLHPKLKYMSSLDHSMWFHAPFRADEPMLHVMESPRSGNNRGLVFGRIYQNGKLVVSCAQEGTFKIKEDSKL